MVNYTTRTERIGKDYEIQMYDDNGQYSEVIVLKTAEDLAFYLSATFWGCVKFDRKFNNPTIWYNGERYGCWDEIKEGE